MIKFLLLGSVLLFTGWVHAEDLLTDGSPPDREPAATAPVASNSRRTYPGGVDDEDLQVQSRLPEASLKTDSRSLQREVYKGLYNQELKDERKEDVEE